MKSSLWFLFVLMMSCSHSSNKETISSDSLKKDTVDVSAMIEEEEEHFSASDTTELDILFSTISKNTDEQKNNYYRITVNANGYEYSTDATWYLDSLSGIRYYSARWASEGNEGNGEYYF